MRGEGYEIRGFGQEEGSYHESLRRVRVKVKMGMTCEISKARGSLYRNEASPKYTKPLEFSNKPPFSP